MSLTESEPIAVPTAARAAGPAPVVVATATPTAAPSLPRIWHGRGLV